MKKMIIACAAAIVSASIATSASATTFSASASVGPIGDVDILPGVAGTFDFGSAVLGTVVSATLTADPCDTCSDSLGTGEFYVFDFSGDIQTTTAGIVPRGTPFNTAFSFSAATLADLSDGILNFTVGCDDNALLSQCSGVDSSDFTLTVETDMNVIPLPAGGLLLIGGLGALAAVRRRKG